jgi:hypothetical protein
MGQTAVALPVNQIENMAVCPEELLFEPELVGGSTGRPGAGRRLTLYLPFARNPHYCWSQRSSGRVATAIRGPDHSADLWYV